MDLQSHPQPELGRLEQIVSQFLLKGLHIILDSRIPSPRPARDRSGDVWSISRVRKSDKWFSLVLGDRPAALDNLHFWHRNLLDPMIIDIILVREGSDSTLPKDNVFSTAVPGTPVETVIERWVVQYDSPRLMAPPSGESSATYRKIYKKSIILLRSLYSTLRLLPGYRVFRRLSSLTQSYDFDITYKVSSFTEPFSAVEEESMKHYSFLPVEALSGCLCISVTYHPTLSDFNLEPLTAFPPRIIADYVGSPAADPLKSFPSSDKSIRSTSFPLRGRGSPAPFQRPHSWTVGGHRAASLPNQLISGSPPTYRMHYMPYDHPTQPVDIFGRGAQNCRPPTHQKATSFDEYQLSPPFSPSLSPSPPKYFSSSNPMFSRFSSETAPVTIPLPLGRGSRYLSPNSSDPSRHSLPPPSPISTKHDPSSNESPSGIRSFRKTEGLRIGEYSGTTNNYSGQKVLKDSKDDSGRFSGLLSSSGSPRIGFSRSSSRLSFQDDVDDCDFSGPFDVDDVDSSDSHASTCLSNETITSNSKTGLKKQKQGNSVHRHRQAQIFDKTEYLQGYEVQQTSIKVTASFGRSPSLQILDGAINLTDQNLDGKRASEFPSMAFPMTRKSQDAAVGALVNMLRRAPPLRQDPSCYSSHSLKAEPGGEAGTVSGSFMARKTADALEELRSYREMKDLLLSKSGTQLSAREEA